MECGIKEDSKAWNNDMHAKVSLNILRMCKNVVFYLNITSYIFTIL